MLLVRRYSSAPQQPKRRGKWGPLSLPAATCTASSLTMPARLAHTTTADRPACAAESDTIDDHDSRRARSSTPQQRPLQQRRLRVVPLAEAFGAIRSPTSQRRKSVRIVCISDTHNFHSSLTANNSYLQSVPHTGSGRRGKNARGKDDERIPPCDVLVHAGDITEHGTVEECRAFNAWLRELMGREVVVRGHGNERKVHVRPYIGAAVIVAGNHDTALLRPQSAPLGTTNNAKSTCRRSWDEDDGWFASAATPRRPPHIAEYRQQKMMKGAEEEEEDSFWASMAGTSTEELLRSVVDSIDGYHPSFSASAAPLCPPPPPRYDPLKSLRAIPRVHYLCHEGLRLPMDSIGGGEGGSNSSNDAATTTLNIFGSPFTSEAEMSAYFRTAMAMSWPLSRAYDASSSSGGAPPSSYSTWESALMASTEDNDVNGEFDDEDDVDDIDAGGDQWHPEELDDGSDDGDHGAIIGEGRSSLPQQVPATSSPPSSSSSLDILITHGPPFGIGDLGPKGVRGGCPALRKATTVGMTTMGGADGDGDAFAAPLPLLHVFGHYHSGRGVYAIPPYLPPPLLEDSEEDPPEQNQENKNKKKGHSCSGAHKKKASGGRGRWPPLLMKEGVVAQREMVYDRLAVNASSCATELSPWSVRDPIVIDILL